MQTPLTLPDLGAGDEELRVSCWLVDLGDDVDEGDRVIEILMDGITFDVLAERSGTLTASNGRSMPSSAPGTCSAGSRPRRNRRELGRRSRTIAGQRIPAAKCGRRSPGPRSALCRAARRRQEPRRRGSWRWPSCASGRPTAGSRRGDCRRCRLMAAGNHPDFLSVACPEGKSELPIELLVGSLDNRGREGAVPRLIAAADARPAATWPSSTMPIA